jgi:hypothetical protein
MKIDHRVLHELRPTEHPLDPTWSHDTLLRVMATESTTATTRNPRTKRRRVALVAVGVAVTTVTGVGVASASGLTSQSLTDAFSSWKVWPGYDADPAQAERVATAPGPDGLVFSVLDTGDGQTKSCRSAILETAESARLPKPTTFTDVYGNFCADGPTFPTFGNIGVTNDDLAATYVVSAGDAVRADVRTPDGTQYPALLVNGDFWGWFPLGEHPTVTGYAADGTVVGQVVP